MRARHSSKAIQDSNDYAMVKENRWTWAKSRRTRRLPAPQVDPSHAVYVFQSLVDLMAASLFIASEVHGRVTLDRKKMPLHEVLDAVCAQVGCVCSFDAKGREPGPHIRYKKS
jgi:hypothetical protein